MAITNGKLFTKSEVTTPDTDDDDPRIGHLLGLDLKENDTPRVVLIGFPSDEGVKRNGGRVGAAQAPDAIRNQLFRLTPDAEQSERFNKLLRHTKDLGNINVSGDVENDQEILGETIAAFLQKGTLPIILGGGHETAFGHFLGYIKAKKPCRILNLDAHPDVRPLKNGKSHSGSPFYQALKHDSGICRDYVVAGLQSQTFALAYRRYLEDKGCRFFMQDEMNVRMFRDLIGDTGPMMITFDMDAVDQAYAPGVSAPNANGLIPDLWLHAARLAGQSPAVTSFDLSEVNPVYDRDEQTARLGALTVWHFLTGLAHRK